MKIPCEVIVWYVLPIIRREVASELVNVHGMTQADVARKFGVTDAAISQYLKKKRGGNTELEQSPSYPKLMEAVRESAQSLADSKTEIEYELCKLCNTVRTIGLLDEIYRRQVGSESVTCENIGGFYKGH